MAIHPGVALGFRPPQLAPLEIQSPLDRYQKMLTLRHLMQQGQLGQMNIEQTQLENEALRQKAQGQQRLSELFRTTPNPTRDQVVSTGGIYGPPAWKALSEAEEAHLKTTHERFTQFATRAGSIQDEKQYGPTIMQAVSDGLISPDAGRQWIELGYDPKRIEQARFEAMKGAEQAKAILDKAQAQREAEKFQLEKPGIQADAFRKEFGVAMQQAPDNQADWTAWRASLKPEFQRFISPMFTPIAREQALRTSTPPEQQLTDIRSRTTQTEAGRHNLQMEKRQAAMEDRQAAQAKETERHNRAMEGRISQATAAGLTQSQSQRVLQIAGQFDNEPMVKNYNTIAEANNFARSLGEKGAGNAGDDQALLYAFAKAMDPGSVVREGEYATVQKYAQSWAQNFGFKAERIFSNSPFLSDDARKQMKDTIGKKATSAKTSYDNIYNEYGRRIERQSGVTSGKDFLTNYGQAFEGAAPAAPAGASDAVKSLLGNSKPGTYTLSDGTRWTKKADGTVTQAGQ